MARIYARRWLVLPSLLALVGAALLGAVLLRGSLVVAGAAQPTSVTLIAPQQVRAGEQIDVQLVASGARNLAGFQATVRTENAQLRVLGATLADDLTRGGRDLLPLGPVFGAGRVTLGAATCPVASCSERQSQAAAAAQGLDGRVVLATIELAADGPGSYVLALDNVRLVDPQGNQLAVSASELVLQVNN